MHFHKWGGFLLKSFITTTQFLKFKKKKRELIAIWNHCVFGKTIECSFCFMNILATYGKCLQAMGYLKRGL